MKTKKAMARLALELATIELTDPFPITFENIHPALSNNRQEVLSFLRGRFKEGTDFLLVNEHCALTKGCAISLISQYAVEYGEYKLLGSLLFASQNAKTKLIGLALASILALIGSAPYLPSLASKACSALDASTPARMK